MGNDPPRREFGRNKYLDHCLALLYVSYMREKILPFWLAGVLFFIPAGEAHAYIDLGTGSYIAQAIIAGLVSSIFIFKNFWRKVKRKVLGVFKKSQDGK